MWKLTLLTGLMFAGVGLIGLTAVSAQEEPQEPCAVQGPEVGDSQETGGARIFLTVACEDREDVSVEITARLDGELLFKASDSLRMAGNSNFTKTLHLPEAVPPNAEVCVTINGEEHCVNTGETPSAPATPEPPETQTPSILDLLPELAGLPGA